MSFVKYRVSSALQQPIPRVLPSKICSLKAIISQSGSTLKSYAMLRIEVELTVSVVGLMDSAVDQKKKKFCVTCVFSLALQTGTCTMEPGVLSIRTGTSGLRWTPSTSPCSLESSCRAETPSGGQVVSGLKSEEFFFQSAAKTTQKIKSC